MNEQLEKELKDKFPDLYDGLTSLSVGDGWFALLTTLSGIITHHAKHKKLTIRAVQVKEKFGGLRFYTSGADEYVTGAVAMAESLSFAICETCGKPAQPRQGGWIQTLCDEHDAQSVKT